MFKSYLSVALRNLWSHKVFSCINILGLAIGMTAALMILLYVKFEMSYDGFNSKADRIYRLVADIKTPSDVLHGSTTSAPMAINVWRDFPEVESAVRIRYRSFLVRKGNIKFQETNTIMADSTLFNIFDFPLIHGNGKTALKEPMSIVFSQTAAKKYFGDRNPVGETVSLTDADLNAVVTGVMKDMPENSQIRADMIVSMSSQFPIDHQSSDSNWTRFNLASYILLKPGTNPQTIESKLPAFVDKHIGGIKNLQASYTLSLEPLRDIYLFSTRDGNVSGNISNVRFFSIIALFILGIAAINFVNLTTARATERAKEVGVRKISGAIKFQLIKQFIGESLMICQIAFAVAVLLSSVMMPMFNQLAGKTVAAGFFADYHPILWLFCIAVGIGVVAGIYPAWILSGYRPIIVLKGRFATGTKGIALRKSLVVAQFTIAIALIISTMVIYQQLKFMRNQDLGFNKDRMIVINSNGDKNRKHFRESLSSIPGVLSTSSSFSVPGGDNPTANSKVENKDGIMQIANLDVYFVDFDFINQYKIGLVAGRTFSPSFPTDSGKAMVINESTAQLLGYKTAQESIGKNFDQWGRQGKIIGVVKDFHYLGLQHAITPLTMTIQPNNSLLSIKISADNIPSTIREIEAKWNQIIPNRPFSYSFLDDSFNSQYGAEDRFGHLFLNFTALAIFISCLGLFGLASYSTVQRTKEIGIRKVLGAGVGTIAGMLSRDFIKLVLMAALIAFPFGWWAMHHWLQNFAYRTVISWRIFIVAGGSAMLVALITVSFQAIKAALANPVNSLRSE